MLDALAYFECLVVSDVEAGDHLLVLVRVTAGEVLAPDGERLHYASTGNLDRSAPHFTHKHFASIDFNVA
nr:flavin reductase [Caballeronia sp. GAOx1]